jgi:hypothetical protein
MEKWEFNEIIDNCLFDTKMWNKEGVYIVSSVNKGTRTISVESLHYGMTTVNEDNYNSFHIQVYSAEVIFACEILRESILNDITNRLSRG